MGTSRNSWRPLVGDRSLHWCIYFYYKNGFPSIKFKLFTPIAATCNYIFFEHLSKQHWGRLQSLPWWCHLAGEVFGELRIAFTTTTHVRASCLHAKDVQGSSQLAKEPVVGQGKERATWFHNLSASSTYFRMFYQSAADLFITLSLGVICIQDTQFLSGKSAIVVIRTIMDHDVIIIPEQRCSCPA